VMHAWAAAEGASGKIDMIADSTTAVSDALDILFDMGGILGKRATRCAFIVEDGVVGHVFMEEVGAFEVSDAGTVLAALTA
ncbi:MAG: peroxiredoxin, partial [Alphaproteobacteria bacterium]